MRDNPPPEPLFEKRVSQTEGLTMSPLVVAASLIAVALFSLLTSYGRIRWFGKKFHWSIITVEAVGSVSLLSCILLMGWQTASAWRPALMVVTGLIWLLAGVWSAHIDKAQRKISRAPEGEVA